MKKLLLCFSLIPIVAFAQTEPIAVNSNTGLVKKTSSGVGDVGKPYDFSNVSVIGIHIASPTASPSPTSTATPTATPTATSTPTPSPTASPTPTPTRPPDDGLEETVKAYRTLGSSIYAQTLGLHNVNVANQFVLNKGMLYLVCVYLPVAETITGVKWIQVIEGNYVATDNNKVGLYSYSAGTLTLEASSTDDGNMWKASSSANSIRNKAFSSTYSADVGTYFVAMLYNRSTATTAPAIAAGTGDGLADSLNSAVSSLDTTNSVKMFGSLPAQTDLPATIDMGDVSPQAPSATIEWVAIY